MWTQEKVRARLDCLHYTTIYSGGEKNTLHTILQPDEDIIGAIEAGLLKLGDRNYAGLAGIAVLTNKRFIYYRKSSSGYTFLADFAITVISGCGFQQRLGQAVLTMHMPDNDAKFECQEKIAAKQFCRTLQNQVNIRRYQLLHPDAHPVKITVTKSAAHGKRRKTGIAVFALVSVFCMVSMVVNKRPKPIAGADATAFSWQPNDRNIEAFFQSREFLKELLEAPLTAVFPWYDVSMVINNLDGSYTISSYVEAQNSAGEPLRSAWQCRLRPKEHGWICDDIHLDE